MIIETDYDEKREELKEKIRECLDFTRKELLDPEVNGYDDMIEGYAIKLYTDIEKVMREI